MEITNYEKAQYLHYMINLLHPYLKQISLEQSQEVDIEAKIQGINLPLYFCFCYCIQTVNNNKPFFQENLLLSLWYHKVFVGTMSVSIGKFAFT